MRPGHFSTFFVVIPLSGPKLWSIKVRTQQKRPILEKYKMATTGHTVGLRKKFRKQKSSVLKSYPWNGAKFMTSDQNLSSYGQKTDFHVFRHKTYTKKISNLKMAAAKLQVIF